MADQLLGGIIINEILADPNGAANFDTDGNGVADTLDEFVEIRNVSASAIDISGLQLWDAGQGNWFTFPDGTELAAGAHALVLTGVQAGGALPATTSPDIAFDAGRSSAALNNGAESVVLLDPINHQFIQATYNTSTLVDPVTSFTGFDPLAERVGLGENFGSDIDGYSMQRDAVDLGTITNDATPTPASLNVCFCSGSKIRAGDRDILVEEIKPGQLLQTLDDGLSPVVWVYGRTVQPSDMQEKFRAAPCANSTWRTWSWATVGGPARVAAAPDAGVWQNCGSDV